MLNEPDAVPDAALEDIAYLSRSGNRLQILDTLAMGPNTRRELEEVTGASRPTLRRILSELRERGWVDRTTDGDYVATAKGEHVVTAFTPLAKAMQAARELDDAVAWLPTGEHSIGLQHFSEATVRRSTPASPMSAVDYVFDRLPEASSFACLTHIAPPVEVSKAMLTGVVTGRLTAKYVMTGELVEYLREQPHRPTRWQEYIENGAHVYHYTGRIPCNLFVVDETVFVGNSHPEVDQACELIESDNETVLSWAHELIELYQAEAERLGVEAFAEGSPESADWAE